jgi:hypothetical protein
LTGWFFPLKRKTPSDRDLVLQEEDGLFAPEAAMVQAWNPVAIDLRGDEALLGKLRGPMLGAVMRFAAPGSEHDFVPSRPGHIGVAEIDGTTVVIGTPLGDERDPRVAYQRLYRALAIELEAGRIRAVPPARPAPVQRGLLRWLHDTFVRPAWTFAALGICVVQTVWLAGGFDSDNTDSAATHYRGTSPAHGSDTCMTRIRVTFRLDASYAQVVLALRRVDGSLASVPSETGEVWLLPSAGQDPHAIAVALEKEDVVEHADLVLPESPPCTR